MVALRRLTWAIWNLQRASSASIRTELWKPTTPHGWVAFGNLERNFALKPSWKNDQIPGTFRPGSKLKLTQDDNLAKNQASVQKENLKKNRNNVMNRPASNDFQAS